MSTITKKTIFTAILGMALCGSLLILAVVTAPASASSAQQSALPTPTAQPDGRIIYIAQPGDSWWSISIKTGVQEQNLYLLNNSKPEDPVIEGQQILLGNVTPTPVPPVSDTTLTPAVVTPAVAGYGEICIELFDDVNGDSKRQEGEASLAKGAVSLVDRVGQINKTAETTAGTDPVCFPDLPEGDYNLSVAVPDGYNPTTSLNAPLKLVAGTTSVMNFGAQLSSQARPVSPSEGGRNPMLGIIGGVLILGGIGIGAYFIFRKK